MREKLREMKNIQIFALAIVIGLLTGGLIGFIDQQLQEKDKTYIEDLENSLKKNATIKGAIECFKPGYVRSNLSKKVKENAELKAVCRVSFNGTVQWINIAESN